MGGDPFDFDPAAKPADGAAAICTEIANLRARVASLAAQTRGGQNPEVPRTEIRIPVGYSQGTNTNVRVAPPDILQSVAALLARIDALEARMAATEVVTAELRAASHRGGH